MFDILNDIAQGVGKAVGITAGTILGIPAIILSETIDASEIAISAAIDAGCETVEEIKDFLGV